MRGAALLALLALGAVEPAPTAADYLADARALRPLIAETYAYPERMPGSVVPASSVLDAQRDAVRDRSTLLHYAEDTIASLADHHAITGASFRDSWALVPSFADLWIEGDRITAVRPGSPAQRSGIEPGDRLRAVDGVPLAQAVDAFWARLGLSATAERRDYAARVLAAGRRNRSRTLIVMRAGSTRDVVLRSLYDGGAAQPVPIRVAGHTIVVNDSLGDQATIAAFDAAMVAMPARATVTIDLTGTPSGGNTSVARAMMGWFVRRPTAYQVHRLTGEERETGVPRQWIEQVLPRAGKHHAGRVIVTVGRWTGSMGEGLAIGFAAIGAKVCGGPMAGLRGAIYDLRLPATGLVVKVPAERLYTVGGVPRERWAAPACR